MKIRNIIWGTVIGIVMLLTAPLCWCFPKSLIWEEKQQLTGEDIRFRPLKGLKVTYVVVETLDDEAKATGLTEERLRTVTELRLREAGISVITNIQEMGDSYIYVNVNVVGPAFNVFLELREMVTLKRDKLIFCYAGTWFKESTGTFGKNPEFIVSNTNALNKLTYKQSP